MFIELIIIYIIYILLIAVSSYYVNLFMTKDQYTKDELKNVLPYLIKLWNKIINSYSTSMFFTVLLISSLFGIIIPLVSYHWIANSAIFFIIIFFVFPYFKKQFEQAQVNTSDNNIDIIKNIFIKYTEIIIFGFGAGIGSTLIHNWGSSKAIYFLWFLINILIVSVLLGILIKNIMQE